MSVYGSQHSLSSVSSIRDRNVTTSAKSSTKKEIESWAKEGQEGVTLDCCRYSGRLMDQVTEQRLLNTKLWDLSKERHRFLSQNALEKKMFLEKQGKKSALLKGMLEGLNTDGSRVSYSAEAQRVRAGLKGPDSTGARMALLERLEPKKNKLKKESRKTTDNNSVACISTNNSSSGVNNFKSAKSVKFNRGQPIAIPTSNLELKDTRRPKLACSQWELSQQIRKSTKSDSDFEERSEKSNETFWRTSEFKTYPGNKGKDSIVPAPPSVGRHFSVTNPAPPNAARRTRSCRGAPELTAPIKDRRYLSLTDLLSEKNLLDKDIAQLIKNTESLHARLKMVKPRIKPHKAVRYFWKKKCSSLKV